MTAPKMTRVAVRVPHTTLEQINDWVDALGVRRSHFLGIALVAGVRSLMRASALDLSWPAPAAGMGRDAPYAAEVEALSALVKQLEASVLLLQAKVASLEGEARETP
jgi:hypothetical protein